MIEGRECTGLPAARQVSCSRQDLRVSDLGQSDIIGASQAPGV